MKQKDFLELSKKQVEELNHGNKLAEEAWRDGYLYAMSEIEKILETENNDYALFILEDITTNCTYLEQFE